MINKTREKGKQFLLLEWPTNKYGRNDGIRKLPSCRNHNKNRIRQELPINAKRSGGQSLEWNRRFTNLSFPTNYLQIRKGQRDDYTVEQRGNLIKSLTLTSPIRTDTVSGCDTLRGTHHISTIFAQNAQPESNHEKSFKPKLRKIL